MYVNHSGWNEKYGSFNYNIFIDEHKKDYELHYKSGKISKQRSEFEYITADWNNDGDVYTLFGAWFESDIGGNDFWTPENLVSELIFALDESSSKYGDHIVKIPGIEVPSPEKRPSLDDTILSAEKRRMFQDIERNKRMNELGIRPSNEPWVK